MKSKFSICGCLAVTMTLALLFATGCGGSNAPSENEASLVVKESAHNLGDTAEAGKKIEQAADFVFTHGKVYTVSEKQPWAEAVAVEGNKIVFVGSSAEAKKHVGEKTKVTDLDGKMLLPGFVEGHFHPIVGAMLTVGVDLQYDSLDEVLQAVKEYADANPDEKLIRGFGWRYHLFPSTGPTREVLDEIVPDRPLLFFAIDGHAAWANSKALEMAGITKETPDPQPGFSHFQRDPKTKEPTGYLVEVPALLLALNKLQPQTQEAIGAAFESLMPQFPAAGITSVFDAGIQGLPAEDGFAIYFDLEKQGKLSMRVIGSYYHNNPKIDPLPIIKSYRKRFRSELVQAEVLKINVDGGEPQHTAAMLQSYADKPGVVGTPVFSPKQLNAMVTAADAAGIDCHFHTQGDRAVRMALDAVESAIHTNPKRDRRHTLGHVIYIQEDDIPRFARLNTIAQMSIQWATPDATNLGVCVERLGRHIVHTRHSRARSIIDAGGMLAFGSDWPAAGYYSTYKPLEAIEVALTRKMLSGEGLLPVMPPVNEILTLTQAIEAATLTPAYQLRLDDRVGTIEVGKLADLIVLEKNLFDVTPEEISDVQVLFTMMNGKVTHQENSFKQKEEIQP